MKKNEQQGLFLLFVNYSKKFKLLGFRRILLIKYIFLYWDEIKGIFQHGNNKIY